MRSTARTLFILGLLVLAVTGCSVEKKSTSKSTTVDSGTGPAPTASETAPLALKMYTVYDDMNYINNLTFQETGTDTCQVSSSTPSVTCTVKIPEGRLYYSKLSFSFSWLASKCKLLLFQPYFYRASNSEEYVAPGSDSTVDCVSGSTAACYGGAAPSIVSSFPKFTGNVYLPDETSLTTPLQKTESVPSAASAAFGSNRHTVNDLADAKKTQGFNPIDLGNQGDGLVAGTYTDYKFYCKDDWYDNTIPLYVINLFVKDEDSVSSAAAPQNQLKTWSEAP